MSKNGYSFSNKVKVESLDASAADLTKEVSSKDSGTTYYITDATNNITITLPSITDVENGWNIKVTSIHPPSTGKTTVISCSNSNEKLYGGCSFAEMSSSLQNLGGTGVTGLGGGGLSGSYDQFFTDPTGTGGSGYSGAFQMMSGSQGEGDVFIAGQPPRGTGSGKGYNGSYVSITCVDNSNGFWGVESLIAISGSSQTTPFI